MNARLTTAALAAAALLPATASAAPSLRLHAIFVGDSGDRSTYHVGEVLFADARDAGGRKTEAICWDPAPIDRPACSASNTAAPARTGTQRVALRLSDGTLLRRSVRVVAPATRVDAEPLRAVPATVTCRDATLFGNLFEGHLRDRRGTVRKGDRVGLYNRLGPRAIFTWDYARNTGGFALRTCSQP